MPIQVEPVSDSSSFPEQVDVVVIGAGVVGTCTAYELASKGVSVALLEKGVVAGEQSSRNWGWVRQQNRDLHELTLAMFSLRRWEELGAEIGRDLGFQRTGILYCSRDEEEIARWERWGKSAREQGFVSELLSGAQAKERTPGSVSTWLGGVWSPTDGRAEPSLAVPAIAEGAKAKGVLLHQNCAVRGIDVAGGKVAGVWTERGLIRTSAVVAAGGAWNSRFCRHHGIDLPVANIGGTAFRTNTAPDVLTAGSASMPGIAIRRRLDGKYTVAVPGHGSVNIAPQGLRYATKFYQMYRAKLAKKLKYRLDSSFWSGPEALGSWHNDQTSPFEKNRILDPKPDADLVKFGLENLIRELPALKDIKVETSWGGMIDTAPDLVPIISKVDQLPGLVIASGFSGHGFGIGPGAGRLASELVLNDAPIVDTAAYRLSRFSDGSAIRRPEMM
ncbi:Glycine/D-amino acid oxidase [Azospirillum oryzae]|uniref:Glycine/D-amino acid oxidase n=1 Tax=Azospirillum oryzae TaxID=286727 RepID=A0A1X7FFL9_9PROT|nr:FAD-binding oxidoreductase [Azospirillum oryzae]SMF51153.1 Glycine/D-amino acid oxidase [Azospirillum oryzae]